MKFYRLEDDRRPKPQEAFSGLGGLYAAGRWHSLGSRVVYVSQSLALASLEKLVHAHSLRALTGLNYFEIEIPESVMELGQHLPADWHADPVGRASQTYGDRWLMDQRSVALRVPSAIIAIEYNCVINPIHPSFDIEWVRGPYPFHYDPRIQSTYKLALTEK